jgi:hypothetical protein
MVNNRILITLISVLAIGALAFNLQASESKTVENFGMLNRTYRVEKTEDHDGKMYGTRGPSYKYSSGCSGNQCGGCEDCGLQTQPNLQLSVTEPFATDVSGALYELPKSDFNDYQGVPVGGYEGYEGYEEAEGYEETGGTGFGGEFEEEEEEGVEPVDESAEGKLAKQPIVYDRFIFANQKSNLYALGDHIRGDLAITPCKTGWFRPSVHPEIDLNAGALSVMGGVNNDSSKCTMNMINSVSGGAKRSFAGVDYDKIPSKEIEFDYGGGDINVQGY